MGRGPRLAGPGGGRDVLAEHRDRVMLPMVEVGICLLIPLAINDFVRGLNLMGAAAVILILALTIDVIAVRAGKAPPIPYPWLLLPIIGSVGATLKTQGIVGAGELAKQGAAVLRARAARRRSAPRGRTTRCR